MSRGHPAATVAVVLLLLIVPLTTTAAAINQFGQDAARTGTGPSPGPLTNDTAFQIDLPGRFELPDIVGSPLIEDGYAYVNVVDETRFDRNLTFNGVLRVDLATAEIEELVPVRTEATIRGMAMDAQHLYLVLDKALEVYDRSTWEHAWTWEHPELFTEQSDMPTEVCAPPTLTEDTIYVTCVQGRFPTISAFIAAVDLGMQDDRWTWEGTGDASAEDPAVSTAPRPGFTLATGVSVIGDQLVAPIVTLAGAEDVDNMACTVTCQVPGPPTGYPTTEAFEVNMTIQGFDAVTGEELWRFERSGSWAHLEAGGQQQTISEVFSGLSAYATGTPGEVYVQINGEVLALNPLNQGTVIWRESIGKQDRQDDHIPLTSFALDGDTLYATSAQTLYRFDTEPHVSNRWSTPMDPDLTDRFTYSDLTLAGDTLYVGAELPEDRGTNLYAVDAGTGEVAWRYHQPVHPDWDGWWVHHYHAVGEGVMAIAGADATFTVLGTTPASLEPQADASTSYPQPGDPVTVDLSATRPGVHGNATLFRAIWGDGTDTGWQDTPTLTHTYTEPGDVEATFLVANEANQTARTSTTFHVGEDEPTEPNMIETAFARENQEMTFGILGIAIAVTGGVIGVTRRYRERSRLQEELEAIEALFEETRDRPVECEAQLTERKAHARGLLTDGHLSDSQFGVVESRIEELKRQLRMDAVEEEFAFLPYSLITALREMLEDGRVTAMEKAGFLAALEDDDMVHPDHKALVRERIEAWFARDAGRGR